MERGWSIKDLKKAGKKLTPSLEKISDGLKKVEENIERGVAPICQ
jgi:hypothetical protein